MSSEEPSAPEKPRRGARPICRRECRYGRRRCALESAACCHALLRPQPRKNLQSKIKGEEPSAKGARRFLLMRSKRLVRVVAGKDLRLTTKSLRRDGLDLLAPNAGFGCRR
ncbi:hypothetical protein TRVL_09982 [Trypanosoma vivax]|nr:hypothetical protein TRVL_09982 [Trypanosoma vivax]